jgi:hypothetical protein
MLPNLWQLQQGNQSPFAGMRGVLAAGRAAGRAPGTTLSEMHPDPQSAYPSAMAGNTAQLYLDAPTNYASVASNALLDITNTITMEWRGIVKSTIDNPQTLIEKPHTSFDPPYYLYGLYIKPETSEVRMDLTINGVREVLNVVVPVRPGLNEPVHVAGTYDGSTMRIYFDGRLAGTKSVSGTINTEATDLFFGRHGQSTIHPADASHDEIRLWNIVRSKEELVLNMDRQLVGDETGLVGLWLFNEGSGTTIADKTGNGLTANVTGSGTWEAGTYTWDGTNDEKHHMATMLNIETYDGSDESVHPSVVYVPGGLGGYNWWMIVTPYPNSNDQVENPSVFASNNGIDWEVPSGVTNPIFGPTADSGSFLADPCLLIIDNHGQKELWLYWLYVHQTNDVIEVRHSRSTDGVTWDSEQTVIATTFAAGFVSPALFHDGSKFVMLSVHRENRVIERRTSIDGVNWSSATSPTVNGLGSRFPWHMDAEMIGSTVYILLTSVPTETGITGGRIHLASSSDGGATINVNDFLTEEVRTFEDNIQYQGSLVLDPVTQDRWWVFYTSNFLQQANPKVTSWHTRLMLRRLKSGEMYQENALP